MLVVKSKEEFLKDPFVELVRISRYPREWVELAFDDQRFREEVFDRIENDIGKGLTFHDDGWDDILPRLPQEFRDDLFRRCSEVRSIFEWHDDFIATMGRESPGMTSDLHLVHFKKDSSAFLDDEDISYRGEDDDIPM